MRIKELTQLLRGREFLILVLGTQAMIALVFNNIDFAKTFEKLACGCMTFSLRSGQLWGEFRTPDAGFDTAQPIARHALYLLKKHRVDTFRLSSELSKKRESMYIIEMVWPRRLDDGAFFMLASSGKVDLDPAWREIDRNKELILVTNR
jgi:hypothetical protein